MGLLSVQQPKQDTQQSMQQPAGNDEETYRRIGLAAMKIIYSKPESDHIIEILRAGKTRPTEAVAQAAFAVIKRLQNEIKGIDRNLAFSVSPPVVALVFEIGMVSDIFTEKSFPRDADPQRLIGETLAIMAKLERGAGQQAPQAAPQGQAAQQAMPQPMEA